MTYLASLFVSSFALLGLALPASAQEKPAQQNFFAQCTSQGQKCNRSVKLRFPVDSGRWNLTLTAPIQHCSDVQYIISTSGSGIGSIGKRSTYLVEIWRSAWLSGGASDSDTLTGGIGPILYISAVGREGGCNQGTLGSWGVGVAIGRNE